MREGDNLGRAATPEDALSRGDILCKLQAVTWQREKMIEILATIKSTRCFSCDCGIPAELFDRIDGILGES